MYCPLTDCDMNHDCECTDFYAARRVMTAFGATRILHFSCPSYNPIYPEEDTDE